MSLQGPRKGRNHRRMYRELASIANGGYNLKHSAQDWQQQQYNSLPAAEWKGGECPAQTSACPVNIDEAVPTYTQNLEHWADLA